MSMLADLEQASGQTFPPLFRQLVEGNRFSWGEQGPNWYRTVFPQVQPQPPVLLYANDYEPIEPSELRAAWEDLTAEDHYNPLRDDLKLLPFARTGAGDHYCFWTNAPGSSESPVLLVWHDDDRADLLAASFQDFLFRKMAEAVVELEEEDSLLSEGDIGTNLQAWLGTHRGWLRRDQAAALQALYARVEDITAGEISDEDVQPLLQLIAFDGIDSEMPYVQS
ncbi:hypothetical protein D7Y26_22490 [Stenotrophomonas maltophilia]|nr:hypothetical protein [Stenotrophomonas maltophilia]MBA0326372.1 hypothetical protein [Stenotrophomonas maltophilia]